MTGELAIWAAALAYGFASSIVIVLNAEVYVVAQAALLDSTTLLVSILMLCLGTAIGKAVTFELVRRGSRRVSRRIERREPRTRFGAVVRRFDQVMLGWLDRPIVGAVTVFVSALLSVPPLAVVTIVAALSKQKHWIFQVMVFLGRSIQFLAIAFVFHRVL